jgi:hypothetical protein
MAGADTESSEPADLNELLTLHQLVETCPWLTERWVRSMVADGRLPRRKIGNRLLFRLDDLAPLIQLGYGGSEPGPAASTDEGPRR